ncbi:MAG: glucose-6-phosphate dehydrogenase assembly protein OpcA [Acidobacteriota bacterium]
MGDESFLGPGQVSVDVAAIEQELKRLWKESSRPAEGQAAPAVMRACQLNLVICCWGEKQAVEATGTAAQVAAVRPSRVIMTVVDPDASEPLRATITAHCAFTSEGGRGKQVCCEQITLTVGTHAVGRLPGAVLPLLLADLPVVLWYVGDLQLGGDDPTSDLARDLMEAADRIVVDSRRFADLAKRFEQLAAVGRPIADLSWARLRGWREVIAGMFDNPAFENHPQLIQEIAIEEETNDAEGPAAAILLGAWMASRLGWRCDRSRNPADRSFEARFRTPAGGAGRLVIRSERGKQSAGVSTIMLTADETTFRVVRKGGCATATVTSAGHEPIARVVPLVQRDQATLLCRCLESAGDPLYEETLGLARRIVNTSEGGHAS